MEHLSREDLREIIKETVDETLVRLGVASDDPLDMQRDFQFLREFRLATEKVKTKGMFAAVGAIVVAILGVLWMGLMQMFGK